MEYIIRLLPLIVPGMVGIVVGIGGLLKYQNGNTKNGKYVSANEFKLFRKDVKDDFNIVFTKIDNLVEKMGHVGEEVARIQGQHEQGRPIIK